MVNTPNKENNQAPTKQKMMGLDLSKSENTPARKITMYHPNPSTMGSVKVQNIGLLVGIEYVCCFLIICSPVLIPRQLRFSLYSGAVITEGLM